MDATLLLVWSRVNSKVEVSSVVGPPLQAVCFGLLECEYSSSASVEFGYTIAAIRRPYRF